MLVLVERPTDKTKKSIFKCDCGNTHLALIGNVSTGKIVSCGCKHRQMLSEGLCHFKHGHGRGSKSSATHNVWVKMRQRCDNNKDTSFQYYGGRGISVCQRWQSFENFLADMGEKPAGLSIDRINNDGNYEPGNCKWSTCKEQANNRRKRRWKKKPISSHVEIS